MSSWQPLAHQLLSMQHLRHPPRLRCQSSSPRRWLAHLQQLHLQLQRLRQQDRRPRHPDRRPGLLRQLLPLSQLQAQDREPSLCPNVAGHLLHELPRVAHGPAPETIARHDVGDQDAQRIPIPHVPRQVPAASTPGRDAAAAAAAAAGGQHDLGSRSRYVAV